MIKFKIRTSAHWTGARERLIHYSGNCARELIESVRSESRSLVITIDDRIYSEADFVSVPDAFKTAR